MKIFFDYSGRGVKDFGKNYKKILDTINSLGHTNLRKLTTEEERQEFYSGDHKARVNHYNTLIAYIKKADIIILELSMHSLSMGYLLQKALESSKPVIALYQKKFDPSFATGIQNDRLQVIEYSPDELKKVLEFAIKYAQDQQDTRFNFFISPKHQSYLDWIAKNRKVPRSVYLRDLIEEDMKENSEYNKG